MFALLSSPSSLSDFRKAAMSEKKGKKRARETSSTSEEEDGASTRISCPICGHGDYRHPRSVHLHIKRKHRAYEKLSEMKERIRVATRMRKKKCPHCQAMKSQLTRHLKICPSRPELYETTDTFGSVTNAQFIKRFRGHLKRPGSGLAESTVRNYLNYIRRIIGRSAIETVPGGWVVTCYVFQTNTLLKSIVSSPHRI